MLNWAIQTFLQPRTAVHNIHLKQGWTSSRTQHANQLQFKQDQQSVLYRSICHTIHNHPMWGVPGPSSVPGRLPSGVGVGGALGFSTSMSPIAASPFWNPSLNLSIFLSSVLLKGRGPRIASKASELTTCVKKHLRRLVKKYIAWSESWVGSSLERLSVLGRVRGGMVS